MNPDDMLAGAEQQLTGEPPLGPRQAILLAHVTCRIGHGPSFTGADLVALDWAARVVGLPAPFPQPERTCP